MNNQLPISNATETNCLIDVFKEVYAHDVLYFNLEERLLLANFSHGEGSATEAEKNWALEIKRLKESGVRVYVLTTRNKELNESIKTQLDKLHIVLDGILYVPNQEGEDQQHVTLGHILKEHVASLTEQPKRIVFIDKDKVQLNAVKKVLDKGSIPFKLYHYERNQRMHLDNPDDFPDNLTGYEVEKKLGGGTQSVYLLKSQDPSQPKLVLKHGASPDAIKMEILTNALYRALGVKVPEFEAYNELPQQLANALNIKTRFGVFQVSRYIQSPSKSNSELIRKTACDDFVIHALLGNIDVAREDQFVDNYLVDAGANFLYRALGEDRIEDKSLLSELDSLHRNSWFHHLNNDTLKLQAEKILNPNTLRKLDKVLSEVAHQVDLSPEQQKEVISALNMRLEQLAYQLKLAYRLGARVEKEASKNTAAGVFTYSIIEGKVHVLLSKRVKHNWWDNFGGKSEESDQFLSYSAAREVREESSGMLSYTRETLTNSPFHDLITETPQSKPYVYRMYFAAHPAIDTTQLRDEEHTEHQWIPIETLIESLSNSQCIIEEEGRQTVKMKVEDKEIILFPPLYHMLQQAPVRAHLKKLGEYTPLNHANISHSSNSSDDATVLPKLKKTHTQGHALHENQTINTSRLNANEHSLEEINQTLVNHSQLVREFKLITTAESAINNVKTEHLSQSEMHMKSVLQDNYTQNDDEANISKMLAKYPRQNYLEKSRMHKQFVHWIKQERARGETHLFFYHGCDAAVAYAYEIYSKLYDILNARNKGAIFRAQGHYFKDFPDIQHLIAHYSKQGKKAIENDDEGYNELALSVNIFLFGNLYNDSSSSIHYMLSNKTARKLSLKQLLHETFKPLHVSDELISELVMLYDNTASLRKGALYQIALPKETASNLSYASGAHGILNPYENTNDLVQILKKLRANSEKRDSSYIKDLQARLMVPPSHERQAEVFYKNQLNDRDKKQYDLRIEELLNQIALDILSHLNQRNRVHFYEDFTLFKHKERLLEVNQLQYKPCLNPHEELVHAIITNDDGTVIEILKENPELKNALLHYPRKQSFFSNSYNKNDDKKALDFIFSYSDLKSETLSICFGERWFDALKVSKHVDALKIIRKINLPSHRLEFANQIRQLIYTIGALVEMLSELDAKDRLSFVQMNQHFIQSNTLVQVLKTLPEKDCLSFAEANKQLIENSDLLAAVIKTLEAKDRVPFAQRNQRLINNNSDLCQVLNALEATDRLPFAKENLQLITNGSDLSRVLKTLAVSERLSFAQENKQLLENDGGLAWVIRELEPKERLSFAQENKQVIAPGDMFSYVLEALELKDRLQFAQESQLMVIGNYVHLCDILKQFDEKDRLSFAQAHQYAIGCEVALVKVLEILAPKDRLSLMQSTQFISQDYKYSSQSYWFSKLITLLDPKDRLHLSQTNQQYLKVEDSLYRVLCIIAPEERLLFAQTHQYLIQDGDQLAIILMKLDPNDRLDFARANQLVIQNSMQLIEVLMKLEPKDRLIFAQENQLILEEDSQWNEVLKKLDPQDRLAFVQTIQWMLKNGTQLRDALNELELKDRLAIAQMNQKSIEKDGQLGLVLNKLDPKDRLAFAQTNQKILQDGMQLSNALEELDPKDRLTFAQINQKVVEKDGRLGLVLNKLDPKDRLAFAQKNQKVLQDGMQLSDALEALDPQDRLIFAQMNQKVIEKDGRLGLVLNKLDPKDRLAFAQKNQNIIQNGGQLLSLLKELEKNDCSNFLQKNQKLIKSSLQLTFILKILDPKARLVFAQKNQSLLKTGTQLGYLLKVLEKKDCLHFAQANQQVLQDDSQLSKVLQELEPKDRLAFAQTNQHVLQDDTQLREVLNILDQNDRLTFAQLNQQLLQDGSQLSKVLQELNPKDRLVFAQTNQHILQDDTQLSEVLNLLDQKDRLTFAQENLQILQNGTNWKKVLITFAPQDQGPFVQKNQQIIKNGYQLHDVLEKVCWSDRINIAQINQHVIQDGTQLSKILSKLNPTYHDGSVDRRILAQANQKIIQDGTQLYYVLNELEQKDRLKFAQENQHVLQDGSQLSQVLETFSSENRFNFAQTNQNVLQNAAQLSKVLQKLNSKDRLAFAQANQKIIAKDGHLSSVLKELYPKDRLAFAQENQSVLQDDKQLSDVLMTLDFNDQLAFAQTNQQCFKSGDQFYNVLYHLNRKDRLHFAQTNQQVLQDSTQLSNVLKSLNPRDRLAFAQANQQVLQDAKQMSNVLKTLEPKDRITYAQANQHTIHSDEDLLSILELLESKERAPFVQVNQQIIIHNVVFLQQLLDVISISHAFPQGYNIPEGKSLANMLEIIVLETLKPNKYSFFQNRSNSDIELDISNEEIADFSCGS